VPEHERFTFAHFMDVRVARLVRKPVRVSFMIDRLKVRTCVRACACVCVCMCVCVCARVCV